MRRIHILRDDASTLAKVHYTGAFLTLRDMQVLKIYKLRITDCVEPEISLNRWCVITTVQLHAQTKTELLKW